jgi:hypothetical protein
MAGTSTRRGSKAAAPVAEPETADDEFEDMEDGEDEATDEVEGDEDDLEELDEDDAADEAPKPKAKASKSTTPKAPAKPAIEFGSPWLAAYITENTDETYDSRGIRMLLRKLAKDGKLEREVGVTRERYQFSGPNDPTVKAVLAMVKSGAAKELKQAGLQAVKDKAAQKKAAAKAAPAPAEPDEMDDEDVEEAPAPAPKRRTAAKTTAPAKATPATRRRTAQTAK